MPTLDCGCDVDQTWHGCKGDVLTACAPQRPDLCGFDVAVVLTCNAVKGDDALAMAGADSGVAFASSVRERVRPRASLGERTERRTKGRRRW